LAGPGFVTLWTLVFNDGLGLLGKRDKATEKTSRRHGGLVQLEDLVGKVYGAKGLANIRKHPVLKEEVLAAGGIPKGLLQIRGGARVSELSLPQVKVSMPYGELNSAESGGNSREREVSSVSGGC